MKKGPNEVTQAAFLAAYIENGGNITQAAKVCSIDRQSHYDWTESDPTYRARFDAAHQAACEAVEAEIKRRGQDGYDEPIVYKGAISKDDNGQPVCVRKFSDTLLIVRAKAMMPEKYRERNEMEHKGAVNLLHGGAVSLLRQELLNDPDYLEFQRQRALSEDLHTGDVREGSVERPLENGQASGLPGPGHNGHDSH